MRTELWDTAGQEGFEMVTTRTKLMDIFFRALTHTFRLNHLLALTCFFLFSSAPLPTLVHGFTSLGTPLTHESHMTTSKTNGSLKSRSCPIVQYSILVSCKLNFDPLLFRRACSMLIDT